ncbi:hypothetical protein JYB64_00535 [Algoriphagus aestuarii]|nr:hypothetical protein [Algoriphagus aestuarii]
MNEFKSQVFQAAFDLLNQRKTLLESELKSLSQSIHEDTKSSAGDKYETGREMIRQEIGKVENQFKQNQSFLLEMHHLYDTCKPLQRVSEGSLLRWGEDWLLISSSIGQVTVEDRKVFLLSKNSPLGQALLGKEKMETVSFRGQSKPINVLV